MDVEASRLLDPDCCGQLNQTPYENVRTHDDRSLDTDSPSVLLDADTGERILHFIENDANVPEGLAVFALPEPHRRRLRTTNALERLNRFYRRRVASSRHASARV